MSNYPGRAEWQRRFQTLFAYRFAESIMQNAIIKDVVSGPVQILRRLLRALKQRQVSLSVDPRVVKAEMTLAELHCILLLKKENHALTQNDERWLKDTEVWHKKHSVDVEMVKGAIAFSRLTEQPYISPFTGEPLDGSIAARAAMILAKETRNGNS